MSSYWYILIGLGIIWYAYVMWVLYFSKKTKKDSKIFANLRLNNIFADLVAENPNLISPYGQDGQLTSAYVSSFWILVGVGVVALPQVAVRAMSYRDARSMHRALIIGTIVVGFIMLNMHLIGTEILMGS